MLERTLKVVKTAEGFKITNPGVLKILKEQMFKGGNSRARNLKFGRRECMGKRKRVCLLWIMLKWSMVFHCVYSAYS